MGGGKVSTPSDPDPRPNMVSDTTAEVQSERRAEKRRAAGTFGRQQTILAGSDNANKKTILGG